MSPEELEVVRQECRGKPCWEIRCGGYVWYISAKTALDAAKKWREVAHRPAGLDDKTLKVRLTSW